MCSENAISVQGVTKVYEIYRKPSHRLIQLFLKDRQLYEEFVALDDVSLEVAKGETVGIIGKNGSGKSTLLQVLAGILTPTRGRVASRGRIAAIIELGTGFNPEFTGIENAKLNATIMGMSRREIDERIPYIAEFSELGDFINKPVKTYSSGMYVRLAFSVVINMVPDILIIDEALAVGDSGFQRKCFRKLDEMRDNGVTILFVTHATDSVVAHCDRAVFMEDGQVRRIGEPKTVVNHYLESLFHKRDAGSVIADERSAEGVDSRTLNVDPAEDACPTRASYNDTEYRWGTRKAQIIDYRIIDGSGREVGVVCRTGERVTLDVSVHFTEPCSNLVYGLSIKTVDGVNVFGSNTELLGIRQEQVAAGSVVRVEFDLGLQLVSGEYFFSIGVVSRGTGGEELVLDRRYDLFRISIEHDGAAFGYAALPFSVSLKTTQEPAVN